MVFEFPEACFRCFVFGLIWVLFFRIHRVCAWFVCVVFVFVVVLILGLLVFASNLVGFVGFYNMLGLMFL